MTTQVFSFRLDKATRAMLERLALIEERTRGDVVKRLIRNAARQLPTVPGAGVVRQKEQTYRGTKAVTPN